MKDGTLIVSRWINLFPKRKANLERLGYPGVETTSEEKDSLNRVIREMKPRFVIINSCFYQAGTPYMVGRLLKTFPKLNIAAVTLCDFPDDLAVYFIWRGAKSYVNYLEGEKEYYRGLNDFLEGKEYIAPGVQKLMETFPAWPETPTDVTQRQMEVLILLCNGFTPERIGNTLSVSRSTVNYHLEEMYKTFHVKNREELEKVAVSLKLITEKDLVFYDRKEVPELPEWAERKIKIHRRY